MYNEVLSDKNPNPAFYAHPRTYNDNSQSLVSYNYISFVSGDTRAVANHKLQHDRSPTNIIKKFYFTGYLDSGMLCQSLTQLLIQKLSNTSSLNSYLWSNFNCNFNSDSISTYSIACISAPNAANIPLHLLLRLHKF